MNTYPQTLNGELDLCSVIVIDGVLLRVAFCLLFPWGPTPRYYVKAEADRLRCDRDAVGPQPEDTSVFYSEVLDSEVLHVRRKGFFPCPGLAWAIDYRRYDLETTDGKKRTLVIPRRQAKRKRKAAAITIVGVDAVISWLDRKSRQPRPSP